MTIGFFTGRQYDPRMDFRADFVSSRAGHGRAVESWRDGGYERVIYGTSSSHDSGDRYARGREGKDHFGDVQRAAVADIAWEGSSQSWIRVPVGPYLAMTFIYRFLCYYICPTEGWLALKLAEIEDAFAAGAEGVEFDEPEFWHRAGYSQAFRNAWRAFYGDEWRDPRHSLADRYRAEKLKSYLYYWLTRETFNHVKDREPDAECILNPHSPMSYAEMFQLRSAEAGLTAPIGEAAKIDALDAFLGEVWSDTIQAPMIHKGSPIIHPFYHSLLERTYFANLVRCSDKRLYHLLDAKSDDPKHGWPEYERLYKADLVSAVLAGAEHFIVAWPDRLFLGEDSSFTPAPPSYRTIFCATMSAARDMENHPGRLDGNIGVAVSDTLMWERGEPGRNYIDGFYGLTLPLLYRGVAPQIFPLERTDTPGYLDEYDVILLSYEYCSPQERAFNAALVRWVSEGGSLLVFGESAVGQVPGSWWHEAGYADPTSALLSSLGMDDCERSRVPISSLAGRLLDNGRDSLDLLRAHHLLGDHSFYAADSVDDGDVLLTDRDGRIVAFESAFREGKIVYVGIPPRLLAWSRHGGDLLGRLIAYVLGGQLPTRTAFRLERGPYLALYGNDNRHVARGEFLDLLDCNLPLKVDPEFGPREPGLLYRLEGLQSEGVVFSSGRVVREQLQPGRIYIEISGPAGTPVVTVLRLGNASEVVAEEGTNGRLTELRRDCDHGLLWVFQTVDDKGQATVNLTWE